MSARTPSTWTRPDGRIVLLRRMEARLLAYLCARAGQIVSVGELLTHVWGYDGGVRSRTVYTTIGRLRAAVEIDPHQPCFLVTVPGGGFRWMGDEPVLLRASPNSPLPRPLDRFVDRPEVGTVTALLAAGHRLVTLTGLGGMGKTRTAIRVANELMPVFVGGVEFVDVADCADPDAMHWRIATALGVHVPTANAVAEAVHLGLGARTGALVVFDNAEHVAAWLRLVLRRALAQPSGATILVTSRAPLGIRGERVVPVAPLSLELPAGGEPSPAAQLFLARVGAPFDFNATDDVEAIVSQLDGVPLAIEFAAARARAIPIADLRRGLADNAIALSRPPESHARDASLERALRLSWEALPENLRRAMGALTILAASFSFALARVALGAEAPDILSALVARGMLQFDGTNYRMLGIVSEFVRRYESVDAASAHRALDRHLATLPIRPPWDRRYSERKEIHGVAHLLPEALLRAREAGRATEARAILFRLYAANELLGHAESDTAACNDLMESAPPAERAQLLLERANLYADSITEGLGEAIDWARRAGDPWTEIAARMRRGTRTGWSNDGDMDALLRPNRDMPPLLRLMVATRRYLFQVDRNVGRAEDRLAELEAELELSGVADHLDLEILAGFVHAHALAECGRYGEALAEFERAPGMRRDADSVSRLSGSPHFLAVLCLAGQAERAHALVIELLQLARHCGHTFWTAMLTRLHARIKAELGLGHAALLLSEEAIRLSEGGLVGHLWMALRDRARIALFFDRIDLAREALLRGDSISLDSHEREVLEREQLTLLCDLREAFHAVDGSRIAILLRRAESAGPRHRALSLALEAWWLAGNEKRSRAREVMAAARAALGPAQGMEREEIERIDRMVEADGTTTRRRTPHSIGAVATHEGPHATVASSE
jgi:tetratricopeptide (TPR) repeat protein